MTTRENDHTLRKKLQKFLKEIISFGTLRGFKHFSMYIRGKEELLLTVINEPGMSNSSASYLTISSATKIAELGQSLSSGQIPYDKSSLMISQATQMRLSGLADEGVGLPPASPSDQETSKDTGTTLFMLACYGRYGCPYVWVRSNHDRLVRLSRDMSSKDKDCPLKLKSTTNWRIQDCSISEIVAEVVKLCTYPPPQNPLAVDFNTLNDLPAIERLLTSGALMQFLEKVVMTTDDNKYYISHVLEDYKMLVTLHMKTLKEVIINGQITDNTSTARSTGTAVR